MANGDSSGLILNLDKISYGVAGVLALVLLAIPLMSGGDLASLQGTVNTKADELRRKSEDFAQQEVPTIRSNIAEQWELGESSPLPAWLPERRPAMLQLVDAEDILSIHHEVAPAIARIEYLRDSAQHQTYLKITGDFGKLTYPDEGEFTGVALSRRKGDGEFAPVAGFNGGAQLESGSLDYSDYNVEAGAVYTYQLVVSVGILEGVANAKIESGKESASSNELGISEPIPHDYSLNIINMRGFDPEKNKDAHFFGAIEYADYANGGEITKLPTKEYSEGFEFGPKVSGRSLWIIRPIDDTKLTVYNTKTRAKEQLTPRDARRSIELPAAAEKIDAPVEDPAEDPAEDPVATSEPVAEDTPLDEPVSEPEPAPTPKPKKPSTGGFK